MEATPTSKADHASGMRPAGNKADGLDRYAICRKVRYGCEGAARDSLPFGVLSLLGDEAVNVFEPLGIFLLS